MNKRLASRKIRFFSDIFRLTVSAISFQRSNQTPRSDINLPGCHGNNLSACAIVKSFAGQMETCHRYHFSLTDGVQRCRLSTFEEGFGFVSVHQTASVIPRKRLPASLISSLAPGAQVHLNRIKNTGDMKLQRPLTSCSSQGGRLPKV